MPSNWKLILPSILVLLFSSCHKDKDKEITTDPGKYVTFKNVVYATDTLLQSMDVYLPANRNRQNTPVVILIHGGGWSYGDKSDFDGLGLDSFFTAKGCALVNMNYRLDYQSKYPAPVYDIGQVMEYVKQKADEWNINADRVCLFGRSAGAHLAMMYAYSGNKDGRVKVVIDGFGPTDLVDSTIIFGPLAKDVNGLLGVYSQDPQAWRDASPLYHTATAVPTIIFQGTVDSTVYFSQSAMLRDSLQQYGIPCMLAPWQGSGHGWMQDKWLYWREAAYTWVSHFL